MFTAFEHASLVEKSFPPPPSPTPISPQPRWKFPPHRPPVFWVRKSPPFLTLYDSFAGLSHLFQADLSLAFVWGFRVLALRGLSPLPFGVQFVGVHNGDGLVSDSSSSAMWRRLDVSSPPSCHPTAVPHFFPLRCRFHGPMR